MKLKAQAWRDAENQGIKAGTKAFRDYYNVRLQTYKQQEANSQAAKDNAKAARKAHQLPRAPNELMSL
jgi:hypothetical protein